MYTATISSQGQITLPMPLRKKLKLTSGRTLVINEDPAGESLIISRAATLDDTMDQLDKLRESLSPETKRAIKKNRGKTAHQMMDEFWKSKEGQAELGRINYGS